MSTLPRSPVEILKALLARAPWYTSAIELEHDDDGEALEAESRAAVAAYEAQFLPGIAYMPAPRCTQCAWWKSFADDVQPATVGGIVESLKAEGFGEALKNIPLPVLGDCLLFECQGGDQVHRDAGLIVSRTGSGEATIITWAEFGCVKFTEPPARG